MHQVPSDPASVVILADFDSIGPEAMFKYLTNPELLVKWWPTEAVSDLREGGEFEYRWPDQQWILRGEFKHLEPGKHLTCSWRWNHEPGGEREQNVEIWMEPFLEKGTRLGIYHREFLLDEIGVADRQGAAEGWIHFLSRLAGLSDGNAED